MYPEEDPNDALGPRALEGVSVPALALFVVISVWIAVGAYYGVHYIYGRLPDKTFVLPHAHN